MPRTHKKVSAAYGERPIQTAADEQCLGPSGSAARVHDTLRILGGRWKMNILFQLFAQAPLRFSELERAIPGVSQKMLASRLRELERDGILRRVVYPEIPPRVDYRLTDAGEALRPLLKGMRDWRP